MKLLEALAESNFKIYTNYECNYELILQILSYYNVIAETLTLSFFISPSFFTKKNLEKKMKNHKNIFFLKIKHFLGKINFDQKKWQNLVILAITSNCQKITQLPFLKVFFK